MKFNKWTVALAAAGLVSLGSVTQSGRSQQCCDDLLVKNHHQRLR
jgi:hypothetical protein